MIERIRLTATAKSQLVALKRKTGIAHNNAICRHALLMSLTNRSKIPNEKFNYAGGVDIDWHTFTGGYEGLYYNLVVVRLLEEGARINLESVQSALALHVHRGLSFLSSKTDEDLAIELANALTT